MERLEILTLEGRKIAPHTRQPGVVLFEVQPLVGVQFVPLYSSNLEVLGSVAAEFLALPQHGVAHRREQQGCAQFGAFPGVFSFKSRLTQFVHQRKFIVRLEVIDHSRGGRKAVLRRVELT